MLKSKMLPGPTNGVIYNFNPGETSAEVMAGGCNKCHTENAAVEHTFVRFYPTLLDFATEKGLIKPTVNIPLNQSHFLKLVNGPGWKTADQALRCRPQEAVHGVGAEADRSHEQA